MEVQSDQTVVGTPAAKFLAATVKADPAAIVEYQPTDADRRIAECLFEAGSETFLGLAKAAGVSRTTLWRAVNNPAQAAFISSHASKAAEFGLGLVHARLLHLALTSRSPAAIELYLKRFDPKYAEKTAVSGDLQVNAEVANVLSMSSTELEKFVELKRRAIGKAEPKGAEVKSE